MKTGAIEQEPRKHLFTREEYYAMGELGWFADQRMELIGGEIIELSPQTTRHANRVTRLAALRSYQEGKSLR